MGSGPKNRINIVFSGEVLKELEELSRPYNFARREAINKMRVEMIKLDALQKGHVLIQTKSRLLIHTESGMKEIVLPHPSEGLPSVQIMQSTLPFLAGPATGFHIGVFGESTEPSRIVDVTSVLGSFARKILHSIEDLSRLTPAQLEELVLDRLLAMKYEAVRAGNTFQADGGIDIVFKSKAGRQLPIMGAVQVKHRIDPKRPIGPRVVRELAGTLSQQFKGQFNRSASSAIWKPPPDRSRTPAPND